jgi:hypothetical protein
VSLYSDTKQTQSRRARPFYAVLRRATRHQPVISAAIFGVPMPVAMS